MQCVNCQFYNVPGAGRPRPVRDHAVWVVPVLLGLLFLGQQLSGLFLGGAFTVHSVSGLAAVRIAGYDRVHTFRLGALVAVVLLATLYVPAPWLVQRFVARR